jgi:hypothetical protein
LLPDSVVAQDDEADVDEDDGATAEVATEVELLQ